MSNTKFLLMEFGNEKKQAMGVFLFSKLDERQGLHIGFLRSLTKWLNFSMI